jgi:hypothetical protein
MASASICLTRATLQWTISYCLSKPEPWLAEHRNATRIFLGGDTISHNLAVRVGA